MVVALLDRAVGLLEDGELGETHVALGDLDAVLRAGLPQAAEVAVAGLHVGDDRAPLADRSTPLALAFSRPRVHRLGAVQELREHEGEGVVGGDAARGELLDDLVALRRARHLDHHVGVHGVDLERLRQHGLAVEGAARVDLAGEEALLVARRLEQRQEHVGARLHDFLVEDPEEALGVEVRVVGEDLLGDLLPARRVVLEGGERERRVGGDAAEELAHRVVEVVHARELALQGVLVGGVRLGQHLLVPVVEDRRRRVPPDLHAGTDRYQVFKEIGVFHCSSSRIASTGRCGRPGRVSARAGHRASIRPSSSPTAGRSSS